MLVIFAMGIRFTLRIGLGCLVVFGMGIRFALGIRLALGIGCSLRRLGQALGHYRHLLACSSQGCLGGTHGVFTAAQIGQLKRCTKRLQRGRVIAPFGEHAQCAQAHLALGRQGFLGFVGGLKICQGGAAGHGALDRIEFLNLVLQRAELLFQSRCLLFSRCNRRFGRGHRLGRFFRGRL